MAYWLVKSEPETWSWAQQAKIGKTNWDGVRNYQAAGYLRAMKKGDLAFFYHSGDEKQVVGVVKVTKEHMPDPKDETGKFVMVDLVPVEPFKTPVTLAQIKDDATLNHIALVKNSRLSVQPVDAAAFKAICKLGGVAA